MCLGPLSVTLLCIHVYTCIYVQCTWPDHGYGTLSSCNIFVAHEPFGDNVDCMCVGPYVCLVPLSVTLMYSMYMYIHVCTVYIHVHVYHHAMYIHVHVLEINL